MIPIQRIVCQVAAERESERDVTISSSKSGSTWARLFDWALDGRLAGAAFTTAAFMVGPPPAGLHRGPLPNSAVRWPLQPATKPTRAATPSSLA